MFVALTNWISLEIPQLAKDIVNTFSSSGAVPTLIPEALGMIALGVAAIFIRTLSRILIFWPGRTMEQVVKTSVFSKMMRLHESFFSQFAMGEIISRISNDVNHIRAFYAFGFLQIVNLVFLGFFTVSKMFSVHPMLSIVALSPLLLLVCVMPMMFKRLHEYSKINQQLTGRLTNVITESFVHAHVIKTAGAESGFIARCKQENEDLFQSNLSMIKFRTLVFPLINSLVNLSQVVVVFYGGHEIFANRLQIGDLLAFNVYLALLGFPLSAFGMIITLYQRVVISLGRLDEISSFKTEDTNGVRNMVVKSIHTAPGLGKVLTVENLNFQYPTQRGDEFSLKNLSFEISPGEKIAVLGKVGSGKSTLFRLLVGLLDPSSGKLLLEGESYHEISRKDLREKVLYCEQTPVLFSTSIRENLLLGIDESRGVLSDEDLYKALALAAVDTDVRGFEEGLSTQIGERGLRLSGGQKQRLALARILMRSQAKLILLDDVFSAVDQETEKRITQSLASRKAGVMIATHRTAHLEWCDRFFYLDGGKLQEITYGQAQDLGLSSEG